jgi:predicted transcriptional regulator
MKTIDPLDPLVISLRDRRARLGLSQLDLAELSGVSARTISGWEAGDYCPRLSTLRSIIKALGCDLVLIEVCDEPTAVSR